MCEKDVYADTDEQWVSGVQMVGLLLLCSRPWDELEAFVKTFWRSQGGAGFDACSV